MTTLRPGDPQALGSYRLVGLIGRGGQGIVYLGESVAGTPVAIKVPHARFAGDEDAVQRFVGQVTATQRVPPFCTARVLDVGVEAGVPYVVSAYVPGESLRELVGRDGPRDGDTLVRLAIGTATALSAIHLAGIVHGDVKPSNVILGPDGPRVIDIGIAAALGTVVTQTSPVVGTPAYLAPEQITGQPVGPPTDIFSWAATLVFAATGSPAFGTDSIPAIMHRILHEQPDLSMFAAPLCDVVTAALAKQPNQRPSAADVVPLLSGRDGAATRKVAAPTVVLPRTVSRRWVIGAIGGVLAAGGGIGAYVTLSGNGNRPAPLAAGLAVATPTVVARLRGPGPADEIPGIPAVAFGPDSRTLAVASGFGDRAVRLWDVPDKRITQTLGGFQGTDEPNSVAFSPDGNMVAIGSLELTLWSTHGGVATKIPVDPYSSGIFFAVAFSPDGALLAAGDGDNSVQVYEAASRQLIATLTGHTQQLDAVAFSPDGRTIASGSFDGTVRLWDAFAQHAIATLDCKAGVVFSVAFSPDGKQLAAGCYDGSIRLWDVAGGTLITTLTATSLPFSIAFSPDGHSFASVDDLSVWLWDTATLRRTHQLSLQDNTQPRSLAFSPDGTLLAVGGQFDDTVTVWQLP